jgi:natural product biosynthesis luciferase-like monooxygenase protein
MEDDKKFSCFLIGADTLLIECGEVLLQKGHVIMGVITQTQRLIDWAQSKQIPTTRSGGDYEATLREQSFDFLFSITHLEIISDSVLALPKKRAVNFHDGPLPRYAGLNTPAWALMNRENQYGISWHIMEPGVDKGDILKQQLFEIAANETSLSINTQCFAAALDSFPMLVDELTTDSTEAKSQDLSVRSYFSKFKRPTAAGTLQWQRSAIELEALVRALDFGEYPNQLGSAKAIYDQHPFIISSAVAGESSDSSAPGTILSIEEGEIKIATGDGALHLTALKTLCGKPLSPGELAHKLGLSSGQTLTSLSEKQIAQLDEINQQLARSEAHWLDQLATLTPIDIPYAKTDMQAESGSVDYQSIEFDLPSSFSPATDNDSALKSAGVFALLLARLGNKPQFDLAYTDDTLKHQAQGFEHLIADEVSLRINIESDKNCASQVGVIADDLQSLGKRGAWLNDVVARHAELRSIPELVTGPILPVGIALVDDVEHFSPTPGSLLTYLYAANSGRGKLIYDAARLSNTACIRLTDQLTTLFNNIEQQPEQSVANIELLTTEERKQILFDWNETDLVIDNDVCIHQLFEQQVAKKPEATALVFEDTQLSYQALNERANQLAAHLRELGVGPDVLVGVNIERSLELMIATLAVMKAGGAYVPLDPEFPADRLDYMIDDANMKVIITQDSIANKLTPGQASVFRIDSDWPIVAAYATENPSIDVKPANLAYVIYTSGSTGKPKGVMVEHRNGVNFFVGMDDRIPFDENSTWLAVTSLSFDISVLELFWTLTRGLKVVIYKDTDKAGADQSEVSQAVRNRPMEFGLFMWGNDDAPGSQKYRLMIEGSKYFDENGFDAVWTPERHFHAFGGPYPNPSVTSAAIAAITKNIKIRSGSCVSPLHHAIRIAEDWSVVDNLSDGRVGLSFAAGWQPNDFVILPENHGNNKAIMLEQIETVKKLWRGEKVAFKNPMGDMVDIETLPRPVQKELPVWLTTAGNPESYRQAGTMGTNVLTHLLGQTVEELAEKVRIYRDARKEAGLDPNEGKVSLMLHTFVGDDNDVVKEVVREPMKDYLRSSMKLVIDFAWAFPAFKRPGGADASPDDIDIKGLSDDERETILDFAFERYFETSGLFGTPDICNNMINRCKAAGIDEIACLLDFGVDTDAIMDSLPLLKQVRDTANESVAAQTTDETLDHSFAAQITRHNVTHFQCTPSMTRMLTFSDEARTALSGVKHMMVGGEAFPSSLAHELKGILLGSLSNMYGPTETTIWSTTQAVDNPDAITIGRPIANTQIYILDANKQPVPTGVPGDLYIGGKGVVRGYLNREELTAERFINNPFIEGDDQKIYWTGDMARYRDDGAIEFLGRVDHQVKIRGYRIELGEIETLLGQHESVKENVLLLREDNPGDQRLAAYVIANNNATKDATIDAAALKAFLREQLPDYMVPSDFVVLDKFPLTPNAKIDRNALPSPQSAQQTVSTEYAPPEDALEETIAKLWQDTLRVEKIGINDNFFDLGGHSLLIVRIHSQLKSLIEQPVSLTDLYGYPTIRSLSQFLNSGGSAATLKKSSDRAQRRRQMMGRRRR